ncbi:hypothetical protein P152DRAFT_434214 [Eremomyces bilateralis CBS 781.70]|uniref:Bacteriophage T5 Orf172 DNA-binding domain-containing protein n=1 Tax=Eremomyces bilateralis CBS 781.70 TaxID=1392243 RepID=A0A6G1G624_9PEZI|nr:uncharacterized protein P152DRAFT_434214 [Eremomyces bilateralis CBS 781.70]KAF1813279.1 hypothetical protein P152DRAFT_434214 [Eremomyces bilateralis CBS 781.70]
MAYNPGVSFFISFHELDPSRQKQCIFFTQKGARCRWPCQKSDNSKAIALRKTIIEISSEAVSLDLLQEYVLCNCCRSGRARHRDRIEDIGLLIPLAQRWQDEIQRHTANQSRYTTSVPALEESIYIPDAYNGTVTPTPSRTTPLYTPTVSPSYYQSRARTSFSINTKPSTPVASLTPYQYSSPRSSAITDIAFQPFGSQPRYNLRPPTANLSTNSTLTKATFSSQVSLSEFRPHVSDPLPSDSVSWRVLKLLEDRDFETGSVYIFDRASSPGHVKIGWTARSVSLRLEDWSKCGYRPNLLFRVDRVPHAQRVETLTHHELLKEWRRERMCKAAWCRKSHQEWFEVSKERAAQVLGDWAEFMRIARPYDLGGRLKNMWREFVETADRNKEMVTAKKLLEHYKEVLVKETTIVEEIVDRAEALKTEEVVDISHGPEAGCQGPPKKALVPVESLGITLPTSPKEISLLKLESWPKQIPLVDFSLPQAEKQPKRNPLFKGEQSAKAEPVFKTESLPRTQFLFTAKPPVKIEPLWKTGAPFKAEPLFKAESLFKTESLVETEPIPKNEPVRGELLAPEGTSVKKELLPERIPLPPSPLLQYITFTQNILPPQEKKPSPSTGTKQISAIDVIQNTDTNSTVVHTSSNPKVNSSISSSTPASLPAINSPSAAISKNLPQTDTHTVEPVSNSPEPLVTEVLLSLSTDEQQETEETLTPITQRQQIVEGVEQAEPRNELLGYDGQTRGEEIRSRDVDESTATESKTGMRADEWDADETLVEVQTPRSLEKPDLKFVDGLCNEIPTVRANGARERLDGLKMSVSEVSLVVKGVLQA